LRYASPTPIIDKRMIVVSLFLIFVMFGSEHVLGFWFDFEDQNTLFFYRKALWNFFCTIWVLLEGVIMLYVLKIYGILKSSVNNTENRMFHSVCCWGIPVFFLFFALMFFTYEYALWRFMENPGVGLTAIHRISVFYIKICGGFWILFDGGVALIGFRTFTLLNSRR
jgi:hypothetical protein